MTSRWRMPDSPLLLPAAVLTAGLALCGLATATSQQPWLVGISGCLGSLGAAALLWRALRARGAAERRARLLAPDDKRLSLLARQSFNAVVLTDVARRIIWVNAGFERITGYRIDEVIGLSPGRLLQCAHSDAAVVRRMREALDRAEPICCELINRRRDGRLFWIEIDMQPLLDPQQRPEGFIAIQSDITERKHAEAALRDSQALLDRTARIGGIGGWTYHPDTGRVQWTEQTARLLGHAPGHQPSWQDLAAHIAPAGEDPLEQALAAARPLTLGTTWDLELPLRDRQGRTLWASVRAETELDGDGRLRVVGTLQDVTERRHMQAEVRRSADLLRGAIDAIDEAFVLYDPDDRLVFCNEKYLQIYATSADLMVPGARFEDIVRGGALRGQYPAAAGRVEEWVAQRLRSHREARSAGVQRLDDGRVVRIVERLMPDGHRVGFRVDITDLVQATEAAERADRAKSEFIATISHELRTPLQTILGFSDLGRHFARDDARYATMFEDIHAGGTRMLRLVNGLLDVSKLDGTQGSLELRRADLGPLLLDVVHELASLALARQLTVQLPQPLPPLPADVDAFRVQQVLRNVLANAIRFAPPGSVISVQAAALPGHGAWVEVRDRGPGIPANELDAVFEPFVQSSLTRNGAGGTGLGLAISRRIMRAHGGLIVARLPDDGPGVVLRMEWPAVVTADGSARATTSLRALRQAQRAGAATLPLPLEQIPDEDAPCATAS